MLSSGSRFGRYEIRERLGAGGMGEVYRARDSELPRDVAIKLLSDPFVTDPARLARFATEARAASALNHPNILTVHDVGESEGQPFIVMECVEGKTLREVIGRSAMAPKALLDIGVQIADGLAKAHAIGIVHRDLKPENVMVTEDGLVKIVDFGLAKPPVFDAGAPGTDVETRPGSPTVRGAILGTVGYMAPEQACGGAVDHRADQFALGAILYEMATGRRAFDCPSSVETLAATLDREPESVARSESGRSGPGAVADRALPRQEAEGPLCVDRGPGARAPDHPGAPERSGPDAGTRFGETAESNAGAVVQAVAPGRVAAGDAGRRVDPGGRRARVAMAVIAVETGGRPPVAGQALPRRPADHQPGRRR